MIKKEWSYFIVGLLVGLFTAASFLAFYRKQTQASDSEKIVLKLAHGLPPTHPVHQAFEFMSRRLAELSNGLITLEIFSDGVLGSETENIEQIQHGALAMTKVSAAVLEQFVPEMGVFGLPYLFEDHRRFWQILDSAIGKELLKAGTGRGLVGLCYLDSGSRSFYTVSKPVRSPDDLRGLKIRVQQSRMAMDMVSVFGAAPTPIAWGELYTALQQGIVDGAENNPTSFMVNRHYEVCRYFTLNEHTRVPDVLLINAKIWNSLPELFRQQILQAAQETSHYQRDLWQKQTQDALDQMQQKGVKVIAPDIKAFVEKVTPLVESALQGNLGQWIKKIKSAQ